MESSHTVYSENWFYFDGIEALKPFLQEKLSRARSFIELISIPVPFDITRGSLRIQKKLPSSTLVSFRQDTNGQSAELEKC